MDEKTTNLVQLLLARLERISADSYFAHRASGIRGALMRALDEDEKGGRFDKVSLKRLVLAGFTILAKAAKNLTP